MQSLRKNINFYLQGDMKSANQILKELNREFPEDKAVAIRTNQ